MTLEIQRKGDYLIMTDDDDAGINDEILFNFFSFCKNINIKMK